jgi:hypothetical protein
VGGVSAIKKIDNARKRPPGAGFGAIFTANTEPALARRKAVALYFRPLRGALRRVIRPDGRQARGNHHRNGAHELFSTLKGARDERRT